VGGSKGLLMEIAERSDFSSDSSWGKVSVKEKRRERMNVKFPEKKIVVQQKLEVSLTEVDLTRVAVCFPEKSLNVFFRGNLPMMTFSEKEYMGWPETQAFLTALTEKIKTKLG